MKLFVAASLSTLALAAPAAHANNEKRQFGGRTKNAGGGGGNCAPAFVFARGSTEPSPIGLLIGPYLQNFLKKSIPDLKTYPVPYDASIGTNVSTARTDKKSTNHGIQTFQKAYQECPNRIILGGGYSQGAAVMTTSVPQLPIEIQKRIAGVALFGSTLNKQNKGLIPGFPSDRAKTWCNKSDGVCGGQLLVNAGHLSYSNADLKAAADWLHGNAQKLAAVSGGGEAAAE